MRRAFLFLEDTTAPKTAGSGTRVWVGREDPLRPRRRGHLPRQDGGGGLWVESLGAGLEDFFGGDAGHHVGGAVVAEVELVAFLDVLDDVGFAFVG